MLNKLSPEETGRIWDIVKEGVLESLPPEIEKSEDILNKILKFILLEQLESWVLQTEEEGLIAFLLTKKSYDPILNDYSLVIYSFSAIKPLKREHWEEGMKLLVAYAQSEGCQKITGYTQQKSIASLFKRDVGDVFYYLVKEL